MDTKTSLWRNKMSKVLYESNARLMLISDIQGNKRDFDQAIEVYERLLSLDKVDKIVFCGDLLHGYPGYEDDSLDLYMSIRKLSKKDPNILFLLGNHELAHVMHWQLQKGNLCFTQDLEDIIRPQRVAFAKYLANRPFAIITNNGLCINHTGPSIYLSSFKESEFFKDISPQDWYANLDFAKEYKIQDSLLQNWDPNYGVDLMKDTTAPIMWEIFMNKNERDKNSEYFDNYDQIVSGFLENMSKLNPCHLLISSHIEEPQGFKVVNDQQFRLCTSYGAEDDKSKKYLLVDTNDTYNKASDLELCLFSLWED